MWRFTPYFCATLIDFTMIQRIQTIYFFLAAICAITPFFIPVYNVTDSLTSLLNMSLTLADGMPSMQAIAYIVAILLPLVAIFLYKNRPLQIRIGRLAMLVAVIALALLVIEFGDSAKQAASITVSPGPGLFTPIAGIVFAFLAVRAVKKDEALVRSADRIR